MKLLTRWYIAFFLLLLFSAPSWAADGTLLWTNRFYGPGTDDQPYAMVLDKSGSVYVTGFSLAANNGYPQSVTLKYTTAGGPVWTNVFYADGCDAGYAYAIAVDASGNVFVTGSSHIEASSSDWDWATVKYTGTGLPLWTNYYGATASNADEPTAIAVDRNGDVYVTGFAYFSGRYNDFVTIKYPNAGIPLWTNLFEGPGAYDDIPKALALDSLGNVYVTGSSASSNFFVCGVSDLNFATLKYTSGGAPVWTNLFSGSGSNRGDSAVAVAVDKDNNLIVTGYILDHWTVYTNGGVAYNAPLHDYATIKYSNAGAPIWTNRFDGAANRDDRPKALAVDAHGNVFVAGYSINAAGNTDFATFKYTATGVPAWTNLYNGAMNYNDYANALAVDNDGNVYVTGLASETNKTGNDFVTFKYTSEGAPVWINRYDSGYVSDNPLCMAVDENGNVFLAGASLKTVAGNFINVICYSGPQLFRFSASGFSNQQFGFYLSGPPGSNAVISASTDLQTWTPVATNLLPYGKLSFTNMTATNSPIRFFRANLQ